MQSKILFVDDDAAVLDALEWTFADEPYACLTCKTPGEALRLMDEIDFAVVVSDQRMPEMSGTDFLEKIKNQSPDTIRVLMTAYQEMNIVLNAVNKGHIYNLIFKPWDEDELKLIIKRAVDDHTLRNSNGVAQQTTGNGDQLIEVNQSLERQNQYLMARFQQAQKMEALGNLASGIAHDFNNILTVIMGFLQLTVDDKSLKPHVYSHLSQALEASDRAKDLVSQILSFSSASENSNKPVKLKPLVVKVLEFIDAVLPRNIEVRRDITVHDEKTQLEAAKVYQILMNLCSNAVEAMQGNDGTITVNLARTRIVQTEQVERMKLLPGEYFCLSVSDDGCGIDENIQERIFDPYFTTKRKEGGTVLGLALINRIVQDHGGRISVESKAGRGSSFTVYLPIIEES